MIILSWRKYSVTLKRNIFPQTCHGFVNALFYDIIWLLLCPVWNTSCPFILNSSLSFFNFSPLKSLLSFVSYYIYFYTILPLWLFLPHLFLLCHYWSKYLLSGSISCELKNSWVKSTRQHFVLNALILSSHSLLRNWYILPPHPEFLIA